VIHDVHTDLSHIRGQVAIASAKLAYQHYRQVFGGARWEALAAQGAGTQRLLWASTGVKDPDYSDVRYVEELIGPETVNTVPPATLEAFCDHGVASSRLERDITAAREILEIVRLLGLPLEKIMDRLLDDGVELFVEAFDRLLAVVEQQRGVTAGDQSRLPAAAARVVTTKS
jgi:transaldolase/glucose-6-phosphate isomerase